DENERAEAQQQLNQYDRQVNDSIYAAFDGKIDIQNRENVSDGEPILQLVADEPQIKATVTEFDLGKIKEGDKVDVKVTSTGKKREKIKVKIKKTGKKGKGEIKKISELPKSYEESLSKSGGGAAASSGSEEDGGAQASNPVSDPSGGSDSDSSKYTIVISDI